MFELKPPYFPYSDEMREKIKQFEQANPVPPSLPPIIAFDRVLFTRDGRPVTKEMFKEKFLN